MRRLRACGGRLLALLYAPNYWRSTITVVSPPPRRTDTRSGPPYPPPPSVLYADATLDGLTHEGSLHGEGSKTQAISVTKAGAEAEEPTATIVTGRSPLRDPAQEDDGATRDDTLSTADTEGIEPTAPSTRTAAGGDRPHIASTLFLTTGIASDLEAAKVAWRLSGVGSLPTATGDASSGDDSNVRRKNASDDATAHYTARLRAYFVNPFNGKETQVNSAVARQLARLGFHRDEMNPLHLAWSPEAYYKHFHETLRKLRRIRAKRAEQERRRTARADDCVTHSAKSNRYSGGRKKREKSSTATASATFANQQDADDDTSAHVDIRAADVLAELLKAFDTPRFGKAAEWRGDVARLMRRRDALTAIPAELHALYASLTSAYMPPKLDATPDPGLAEVELTEDQKNVAQLAMQGYSIYIGGSAGTGKTVLIKDVCRQLSRMGLRVAMTATTGVAAVQLGGCTFHRAFNVPVGEAASFGKPKCWDYGALRAIDVLIIDEVSLLSAHVLDAFDMEARLARMQYTPFGGIQLIVCGDFLQLANQSAVDAIPAYESNTFCHLRRLKLVTPMRHVEGDPLNQFLRQLRRGHCDTSVLARLDRPIPAGAKQVTHIFPRRRDAQLLNDEKLSELRTAEMVCTPQRGPLQLVGTFTHSALLTFEALALPLPSRESIVAMVRDEVMGVLMDMIASERATATTLSTQKECSATRHSSSSQYLPVSERSAATFTAPGFRALADHDIVVMPTRTTTPGITLRLRVAEDLSDSVARREARLFRTPTTISADTSTSSSVAASSYSSSPSATTSPTTVTSPVPLLRSPAAYLHTHPDKWVRVVERVANRLGGTLVQMLEQELSSLAPLTVSSALANQYGETDATESLLPLRLKLGCRVMVNRNLSRTVSNGSVGVVEAFAPPDPKLFPRQTDVPTYGLRRRLLGGQDLFTELPVVRLLSGEVVQVPPVSVMLGGTPLTYYYGHEVYTLPLQLGYGFTVHKVQGLTLHGTVVLDCKGFFECPHLIYVACSRVRSLDQLVVRNMTPDMVLVRKSALDFSDSLQEAKNTLVLAVPPEVPRAAWTQRFNHRVQSL